MLDGRADSKRKGDKDKWPNRSQHTALTEYCRYSRRWCITSYEQADSKRRGVCTYMVDGRADLKRRGVCTYIVNGRTDSKRIGVRTSMLDGRPDSKRKGVCTYMLDGRADSKRKGVCTSMLDGRTNSKRKKRVCICVRRPDEFEAKRRVYIYVRRPVQPTLHYTFYVWFFGFSAENQKTKKPKKNDPRMVLKPKLGNFSLVFLFFEGTPKNQKTKENCS